ncbi:hypothetical protein BZA05DRAFT_66908 [Tricharina praecox]|uniref:uncharacterized protein n=1 Tax=Tricharina praecox TaxID=43433 RepID=UPI00221FD8A1|nr:uncharacterized protein BZA05DRAFT_66908 [Tricharina praecox]KAI5850026.1 hypothetical protein BZA05DRAFT_66908 [Tricharina praecox]
MRLPRAPAAPGSPSGPPSLDSSLDSPSSMTSSGMYRDYTTISPQLAEPEIFDPHSYTGAYGYGAHQDRFAPPPPRPASAMKRKTSYRRQPRIATHTTNETEIPKNSQTYHQSVHHSGTVPRVSVRYIWSGRMKADTIHRTSSTAKHSLHVTPFDGGPAGSPAPPRAWFATPACAVRGGSSLLNGESGTGKFSILRRCPGWGMCCYVGGRVLLRAVVQAPSLHADFVIVWQMLWFCGRFRESLYIPVRSFQC